MSDKPTKAQEELQERILSARKNGSIVFWGLPGQLLTAYLEEFVKQPAEGMLYDLNRLEEISLTFLGDPKWVNDFAVAMVIRKLVEQRDAALAAQSAYVGDGARDAARLDYLEREANEEPILLHGLNSISEHCCRGLGLSSTGRSLREALDQLMSAMGESKSDISSRHESG